MKQAWHCGRPNSTGPAECDCVNFRCREYKRETQFWLLMILGLMCLPLCVAALKFVLESQ